MYISATDHQKGISMQMTSTTPATSLFISLHTNNTLYLSSSIPPLQRQLLHLYSPISIGRKMLKSGTTFSPPENQSINGFDVLLYAICTCNGKTSQPSILVSTATCIQGTSQGGFLQERNCHLGTKPSDA